MARANLNYTRARTEYLIKPSRGDKQQLFLNRRTNASSILFDSIALLFRSQSSPYLPNVFKFININLN